MVKDQLIPGEFRFEPVLVSRQATQIAEKALKTYYFSETPGGNKAGEKFLLNDQRVDGNGKVEVFNNMYVYGKIVASQLYQSLGYADGVLLDSATGSQNSFYGDYSFYPETKTTLITLHRNQNIIKGFLNPEFQQLTETFQMKDIDLKAVYRPAVKDGIAGFKLDKLEYFSAPLQPEDIAKIFPAGRFVSLETALTAVINHRQYLNDLLTGKTAGQDFIGGEEGSSITFMGNIGRSNYFGQVYSLTDNQNKWLTFINLNNDSKRLNHSEVLRVGVKESTIRTVQIENEKFFYSKFIDDKPKEEHIVAALREYCRDHLLYTTYNDGVRNTRN